MKSSPENIPYFNSEGSVIDFGEKRFQFWLETVPPDLRRLEYELYKRNRKLINANLYRFGNQKKYGRFTVLPEFTEDLEKDSWENFKDSFLKGEDRRERFSEILGCAKRDLPELLEKNSKVIPKDKIKLIALAGSSIHGPRRPNEPLSDVDLNFLLDEEADKLNFDVLPEVKNDPKEIPYHLFGTGRSDDARGQREIHWLLYPHFPIQNSLSDEELKSIIKELVDATEERKDEILKSIENLDNLLKQKSEKEIIG